jgi:uncharacterized protein
LYCAGHLLEAAIAYYQLTGKPHFLNAMMRYITLIQAIFGLEEDQLHGYPGHEELELALMKLFRITNAPEHRDLARYFVEERGQRRNGKHFYELEAERNGVTLWPGHFKTESWFEYMQAGKPIREQETIEGYSLLEGAEIGHAVRAMYFLCGVSEVGLYVNDISLLTALVRLYKDMVERKMYITYGIGSVHQWEGFGEPYDLPNEEAYCETCAGIGLVFLCHRLLKWDWDTLLQHGLRPSEIADVMEGALYNNVGGSVSVDGKSFFYANPLETHGINNKRKDWFDVSCCPPNVARLFSSLGEYVFMTRRVFENGVTRIILVVILYMDCTTEIDVDGQKIMVHVESEWPLSGVVKVWFDNAKDIEIELRLRIPSWGDVESMPPGAIQEDGFMHFTPRQYDREKVSIHIPFTPNFIHPDPRIVQNRGRVAIRRGPLIYAMETTDNNFDLSDAQLEGPGYLEEVISIGGIDCKRLYLRGIVKGERRILRFIPYWSWGNRESSNVLVWVSSKSFSL